MKIGVVIPVGNDRLDNLRMVLRCLAEQTRQDAIAEVVLVYDGIAPSGALPLWELEPEFELPEAPVEELYLRKHHPGMEQPRNVGVRALVEDAGVRMPIEEREHITHVWFLDSDILLAPEAVDRYMAALEQDPDRVLVGPYDWLPPGIREPVEKLQNDPRWVSFNKFSPEDTLTEDLSAGLACFSGNLVWPIDDFLRVGGFWNELHHGRCEDGELGLRAVAMGVPIGFVRDARGWHMEHPRDVAWIEQANARDVPMLNDRHPWVQGSGMFVVEEDGKRFDARCTCGWEGNTALIWEHQGECPESDLTLRIPESDLTLRREE